MDVHYALEMAVSAKFLFEWHLHSFDKLPYSWWRGTPQEEANKKSSADARLEGQTKAENIKVRDPRRTRSRDAAPKSTYSSYFSFGGSTKKASKPALKKAKSTNDAVTVKNKYQKKCPGYWYGEYKNCPYDYIPDSIHIRVSLEANWGFKALFETQFNVTGWEKDWKLMHFGQKYAFFIGPVPVVIEPYVRLNAGIKAKDFEVEELLFNFGGNDLFFDGIAF